MSNWFEIAASVMQAQDAAALVTCKSEGGICPATAFNAITAAFATQGYFMQADMLYFLVGTGFGVWAPILYLIAAAGGIISLAMGAPPKMYIWFFVGPGIYHWLVETRAPAHGVQWQVARVMQDQRQVWRLAHVGLVNSSIAARMAGELPNLAADTRYELGTDLKQKAWCSRTNDPVYVSNFFLWFDDLVSYTVQRLVDITGITRTATASTATGGGGNQGVIPLIDGYTNASTGETNNWYLMADKKWVLLDTITSARLSNSDLRDAFVSFLSSECGDGLSSMVDKTNFVIASNSSSGQTPCTVMLHTNTKEIRTDNSSCTEGTPKFLTDKYWLVWDKLRRTSVPIQRSTRKLFQDSERGSFVKYLNVDDTSDSGVGSRLAEFYRNQDSVECHQEFYTIMQAFRWEAAQIYNQLIQSGPIGLKPKIVLYNLFYGWGARKNIGGDLIPADEMEEWTRGLIFVHLLRNELAIAPRLADKKFSNENNLQTYSQNYIAATGSKAKYGEVYSWARMIPYIQGILLYLLAMGYPFACIMIVMPGWHKTLFTWMSFWVWVKLWDAGFAVVTVAERSIWSMLGNSTKLNYTSPLVYQMKEWGHTQFLESCPTAGAGTAGAQCFADLKLSLSCMNVPDFINNDPAGQSWWQIAAFFDRALLLGSNMDIDVANGYYIYLMSALYFAVPAATGQLVLGAKAGVAGMANTLMQGAQQDGGRGVSSGFLGNFRNQAAQGAAAMRQEAHAKALRTSGLAARSFDSANNSLAAGLEQSKLDTANRQMGLRAGNMGAAQNIIGQRFSAARERMAATHALGMAGAVIGIGKPTDAFDDVGRKAYAGDLTAAGLQAFGGGYDTSGTAKSSKASPLSSGSSPSPSGSAPLPSGQAGLPGAGALNMLNPASIPYVGQVLAANQASQALLYPVTNARSALGNMGAGQQNLQFAHGMGSQQAEMNYAQAGANLQSFGWSSQREAFGIGERRNSQLADFGAQDAVYRASVSLGDNAAGYIGSLGGDASVVSPTSKPTEITGMAMSGRLGINTQNSSNWAMRGFFSDQASASGYLQQNYGTGYVNSGFTQSMNNPDYSVQNIRQAMSTVGKQFIDNKGTIPNSHKDNE